MENEIIKEFLREAIARIKENTGKIEKCLQEITEEEIWNRPNESSNSIGNQLLHVCGNITQYIISGLGDSVDIREREKEFAERGGFHKDDLLEKLYNTVNKAIEILVNFDQKKILDIHQIQVYNLTSLGIIMHVVEHFSYHTGQVIFYTKLLKNKDLGFYANVDLN